MDHEANVQLFPEEEELVNILNIKRGIISALLLPLSEEQEDEKRSSIMVSVVQVNRSIEYKRLRNHVQRRFLWANSHLRNKQTMERCKHSNVKTVFLGEK